MRLPDGFEDAWQRLCAYVHDLPVEQRPIARRVLVNRLKHPEYDGTGLGSYQDPGPSRGGGAYESPRCLCGSPQSGHDIDGQRDDCDGYVPEPC